MLTLSPCLIPSVIFRQWYNRPSYRNWNNCNWWRLSDSTLDLLRSFGSSISVISEPDEGMYDAINKGIRLAKGDVISYLNSDDLYHPNTLSTVFTRLTLWLYRTWFLDLLWSSYNDGKVFHAHFYQVFDPIFLLCNHSLIGQPAFFGLVLYTMITIFGSM